MVSLWFILTKEIDLMVAHLSDYSILRAGRYDFLIEVWVIPQKHDLDRIFEGYRFRYYILSPGDSFHDMCQVQVEYFFKESFQKPNKGNNEILSAYFP